MKEKVKKGKKFEITKKMIILAEKGILNEIKKYGLTKGVREEGFLKGFLTKLGERPVINKTKSDYEKHFVGLG